MERSQTSGACQDSLHSVESRNRGVAKPLPPRRRQGVRPYFNRPIRRARGCSRCRNAVRLRNFSCFLKVVGLEVKVACAALIPAFYERFGDRLPTELRAQYEALLDRLAGLGDDFATNDQRLPRMALRA